MKFGTPPQFECTWYARAPCTLLYHICSLFFKKTINTHKIETHIRYTVNTAQGFSDCRVQLFHTVTCTNKWKSGFYFSYP